jgi:hypothetical protein
MTILHPEIERLAILGWRLYPASSGSKAGCFKGATDAATCDLDQLARWDRAYPHCNWRVVMEGSNIWCLDCDVPPGHADDGIANLARLVAVHGPIPPRPQLRSGGGGLALFFRDTGSPIIGAAGNPALGIDPRRGRQSQTVPPSRHFTTGQPYRWIDPPWDVEPPPAPAWLLRLVAPPPEPEWPSRPSSRPPEQERRYAIAALRNAVQRVATAPQGARNCTLNAQAFALRRFVAIGSLGVSEIAYAMATAAEQVGLDRIEIRSTLSSALRVRVPS